MNTAQPSPVSIEQAERAQREAHRQCQPETGDARAINQLSRRSTIHERIQLRLDGVNEAMKQNEFFASHLRTVAAMLPPAPTPEQEEALHHFFSI